MRKLLFMATISALKIATAQSIHIDEATAKDRLAQHAILFDSYARLPKSLPVEARQPNAQGIVDLSVITINDYMYQDPMPTPAQDLAALLRRTDAVLLGTATRRYSALNPRRTYLYSDWVISVTRILKNASTIAVHPEDEISTTRPCGETVIDGRRVIAKDRTFQDFELDRSYVFFLSARPDSKSFQALPDATFDITGTAPVLLGDPNNPTSLKQFSASSKQAFLTAVERALAPRQ
jgi:hypothetical protein